MCYAQLKYQKIQKKQGVQTQSVVGTGIKMLQCSRLDGKHPALKLLYKKFLMSRKNLTLASMV